VRLSIAFDPEIVELGSVEAYGLWLLDRPSGVWTRVREVPPGSLPVDFEVGGEGIYGLRASVKYRDGREFLVPVTSDSPQAWFCVDRTPPRFEFSPSQRSSLPQYASTLDLSWSAEELRFGNRPLVIEWREPGGSTGNSPWRELAKVPARSGTQSYRVPLPRKTGPDLEIRLRGSDLTGNEGAAVLALVRGKKPSAPRGSAEVAAAEKDQAASRDSAEAEDTMPDGAEVVDAHAADLDADDAGPAAVDGESRARPLESGEANGGAPAQRPEGSEAAAATSGKPAASASAPAEATGDGAEEILVRLQPLEADCFRGGEVVELRWRSLLPADRLDQTVKLEYDIAGAGDWKPAAEAKLGAGSVAWTLPELTALRCRVRLLTEIEGRELRVESDREFAIDSQSPKLDFGKLAEKAGLVRAAGGAVPSGSRLRLAAAAGDEGCAGLEAVRCFARRAPESAWQELEGAVMVAERGEIAIEFSSLGEGTYEVFLSGRDRAGNEAPPPGPQSAAQGRVLVDTTAPAVAARTPLLPWVGGIRSVVVAEFDAADCAPPVILEGREPGGEWQELRRFASLAAAREQLDFRVPSVRGEYEVRALVRDRAGNEAEARFGPRAVEKAIRLESFREPGSFPAFSSQKVVWSLHPLAREVQSELRVAINFQRSEDPSWQLLAGFRPAGSPYDWNVPGPGGGECRLRVRLFLQGEAVGEDESAPFSIIESSGEEAQRPGFAAARMELQPEPTAAVFREALAKDPADHDAAYKLARLLNQENPEQHAREVLGLLRQVAAVRRDDVSVLNDLAVALIRSGDFAEAEQILAGALERADSPLLRFNLGLALLFQEKPVRAREELEASLGRSRSEPLGESSETADGISPGDAYFYIAFTYLQEKRVDDARAVYRERASLMSEELRSDLEKRL
jgi:hypothetical protein